jgi:hypothetical protein
MWKSGYVVETDLAYCVYISEIGHENRRWKSTRKQTPEIGLTIAGWPPGCCAARSSRGAARSTTRCICRLSLYESDAVVELDNNKCFLAKTLVSGVVTGW